jgi:hypothetical protein
MNKKKDNELVDPRDSVVNAINLSKSRINQDPPIVFLCGGQVEINGDGKLSARDTFLSFLKAKNSDFLSNITLAENFEDWMKDSIYDDLLEFEEDLAGLATLVLIVLESPGSLSELGAFVVNEVLKEKVVAILTSSHYSQASFITLGPIAHIEKKVNKNRVIAYEWDHGDLETLDEGTLGEIADDVSELLKKIPGSREFKVGNNGHIALLAFELIFLFHALLQSEIHSYLNKVLVDELSEGRVRRILFLLQKFGLVKMVKRGHYEFYVAEIGVSRVNLAGKFNVVESKISTRLFYDEIGSSRDDQKNYKRLQVVKYLESNSEKSEVA